MFTVIKLFDEREEKVSEDEVVRGLGRWRTRASGKTPGGKLHERKRQRTLPLQEKQHGKCVRACVLSAAQRRRRTEQEPSPHPAAFILTPTALGVGRSAPQMK